MHDNNHSKKTWKQVDFTTIDLIRAVSNNHATIYLGMTETAILKRLVEVMGPDRITWQSAATIAMGAGCNEKTARLAIKSLLLKGYLDRKLRRGKPQYTINVDAIRND